MKAQDITSQDNNRKDAIDKLILFCDAQGLSYIYGETEFKVQLPGAEPIPMTVFPTPSKPTRKTFSTDGWGERTYIEGEEPDPTEPLTEGEPPRPQL